MTQIRFVLLPNGDRIRADTITAIRKGDAQAATNYICAMVPRVIIDFGECGRIGGWGGGNSTICFCKTDDERDLLAAKIYLQCHQFPLAVRVKVKYHKSRAWIKAQIRRIPVPDFKRGRK
jgi:hypothetical protein